MSASCNLLFLDFNYAAKDNVVITPTSENTEFLAANLRDPFRARVWKSDGHFLIDTSNQNIDFLESGGGPELNAVLTIGSYTVSELEAEIKLRMETAGAETYTVDYSELTGEWTISSAGAFLSILFSTGSSGSPLGPAIGFLAGDRTGATTYTGSVAIHTSENVVFDLGSSEKVNTFTMFFDPRRGVRFSDAAIIRLQANPTDDWSAPAVDVILVIDNEFRSISHFFATSQQYRYWRVEIIDKQNTDLSVELGVVAFGEGIQLTRNASKGFKYKIRDNSVVRTNLYGNSYTDIRPKVQRLEVNFKLMPQEDLKTLIGIINRVGKTEPIVVAFDSQEVVFDKDLFLIYGKFTTQLNATNDATSKFTSPMNIEETF